MHCFPKLRELAFGQISPGTGRQSPYLDWTDARADELDHGVAYPVEHTPDDPVPTLVDHDAQDGPGFLVAQRTYLLRDHPVAVNGHPATQGLEHRWRRETVDERLILLLHLVARVHDAVGKVSVIREQEQAGRRPVEPSYRNHALRHVDQVHDGAAIPLVAHRRDIAGWLVEHDVA